MPRLVTWFAGSAPIGPEEVRVSFMPAPIESPPARYAVWRGQEQAGWLLDWTEYPDPTPVKRDPTLGYVMTPTLGNAVSVYGAERLMINGKTEEIDDAWTDRVRAIEAIIGEPIRRAYE